MVLGIDQSKRSTAITALNSNGEIVDCILINPGPEYDMEQLVQYQWNHIKEFIDRQPSVKAIALESLAFGSVSKGYDLLCGIHWYIRTQLLTDYPHLYTGVITATQWRSKILTPKQAQEYKRLHGGKVGLKYGVLDCIPSIEYDKLSDYLESQKERLQEAKGFKAGGTSTKYQECMFDLGDSYGIAKYRLSLMPKVATLNKRKI